MGLFLRIFAFFSSAHLGLIPRGGPHRLRLGSATAAPLATPAGAVRLLAGRFSFFAPAPSVFYNVRVFILYGALVVRFKFIVLFNFYSEFFFVWLAFFFFFFLDFSLIQLLLVSEFV